MAYLFDLCDLGGQKLNEDLQNNHFWTFSGFNLE